MPMARLVWIVGTCGFAFQASQPAGFSSTYCYSCQMLSFNPDRLSTKSLLIVNSTINDYEPCYQACHLSLILYQPLQSLPCPKNGVPPKLGVSLLINAIAEWLVGTTMALDKLKYQLYMNYLTYLPFIINPINKYQG